MTAPDNQPGISPALLQCGAEGWRRFSKGVEVVRAESLEEVRPALAQIEDATGEGLFAAGFITYEAASAFDGALVTHAAGKLPLLWFGIYERCESVELPPQEDSPESPAWRASLDQQAHRNAVERIHELIASGDTYQVNFTWRLTAPFDTDPWAFFLALANRDRTRYASFVDTGDHAICSFSPELFFRLDGDELLCRPMKGTADRGRHRAEDNELRERLRASPKNRAENVMIVDMVRNDLGRLARPGSVQTRRLFDIETYPTVHQMTSTVEAKTDGSLSEILAALFPCSSITGAPKVETMKIISELEKEPRGVYTGAIGYAGPERQALFSVAIRTVHVDLESRRAEYGTGGGIVWDSEPEAEYSEGKAKTLVLSGRRPAFRLLETMRWEDGTYHLLRRHLDRLADSAELLGFAYDETRIRNALADVSRRWANLGFTPPRRVRLLVSHDGRVECEHEVLAVSNSSWVVELAGEPIDPQNRFYYHKTTRREAYEAFRNSAPSADDILLWNPSGELTESTLANLALQLDGTWYTPPVASGLLAGTQRAEYLAEGRLTERVLTLDDLDRAEGLALINSVRGWIPARLARSLQASS